MGIVYRAFDPILERDVALKTMMSSFTVMDEESRSRFYREARAAGKLRHPNIVTIYDMGDDQGTPYIAMELLEGIDLHRKMKSEGPLPPRQAVEIVAQASEGLSYAHGFGIVHRDIKPANIFITGEGAIKILDFGIAKLAASEMTRSGMVLGTVDYMSPEQIRADRAMDGRSDLFSLGVILYELLSAQKPFPGETLTQVMYKIVYEEPIDINSLRTLPAALSAIVARALQKDPAGRFQSGLELAAMLWEVSSGLGTPSESGRLGAGSFTSIRLAAAQRLLDAARASEAAIIVREVLEAEPQNTGALALSEMVQARLKSQVTAALSASDLPAPPTAPGSGPPPSGPRPTASPLGRTAPITTGGPTTAPLMARPDASPPPSPTQPPPSASRLAAPPQVPPATSSSPTISLEEPEELGEPLEIEPEPIEPRSDRTARRGPATGSTTRPARRRPAPPPPARARVEATKGSRIPLIAAGVATLLIVATGGVYLMSRGGATEPVAPAAEEPAPREAETPVVPAAVASGFLAVDAAPWAEVGQVIDVATGERVRIDSDTTPCVLAVPPGRYRLVLHHPEFGDRTAQAVVSSGSMTRVFETMPGFTAPLTPQRSDR
jgi:serine/threonine-protein kinase